MNVRYKLYLKIVILSFGIFIFSFVSFGSGEGCKYALLSTHLLGDGNPIDIESALNLEEVLRAKGWLDDQLFFAMFNRMERFKINHLPGLKDLDRDYVYARVLYNLSHHIIRIEGKGYYDHVPKFYPSVHDPKKHILKGIIFKSVWDHIQYEAKPYNGRCSLVKADIMSL